MRVLVTGGAGYIGSHAVKRLKEGGHHVVVMDNLFRGHAGAIDTLSKATGSEIPLERIDLRDTESIRDALTRHGIECVMHFAALAYVGESVSEPLSYYDNNTTGTTSLLRAMNDVGVHRMVFSSTCATYGEPERMPIVETMPQKPINPYGWSKLFVERILFDYAAANKEFGFAALRYFNVAGSSRDSVIGEDHTPETHLIPVLLNVALGKKDKVTVFGNDYHTPGVPNPDGTAVRDYIHVEDLVDAHVHVMQALKPGDTRTYNLGIGQGKTVMQVIEAARKITGHPIPAEHGPRRPGDPPELYADASKIKRELGWEAKIRDIETMVSDAWRWFKAHRDGYKNQ